MALTGGAFSAAYSSAFARARDGTIGQITRLGGWGGPRRPFGSFAGKAQAVVVVATTIAGAGKGKRPLAGYPRWVLIGDRRYRVQTPDEERRLLAQYLAEQQAKLEALQEQPAPSPKAVKSARIRIERVARRIEKVDTRADEWHARLRNEDEEILLLLH